MYWWLQPPPAYAGVDLGDQRKEAKNKAAGKKAFDILKAFGKNTKKSDTGKLAQDISKAQSKFTKAFTKADAVGGDACPFVGDAADVELAVDDAVAEILSLISVGPPTTTTSTTSTTTTAASTTTTTLLLCGNGVLDGDEQCDPPDYGGASCESLGFNLDGTLQCTPACQYDMGGCECEAFPATGQTTAYQADKNDGIPGPVAVSDDGTVEAGATLSYVDNGDGTVTDLNTGLMWEKKSDDGGLHDKDNTYLWSGNGTQETIWDWLDDVNAEGSTGFAGYSDWRIPNIKELISMVDVEPSGARPVTPEFDSGCAPGCTVLTCSCTAMFYFYWSSTTIFHDGYEFGAIAVDFYPGAGGAIGYTWAQICSKDGLGAACFYMTVRAVRGGL